VLEILEQVAAAADPAAGRDVAVFADPDEDRAVAGRRARGLKSALTERKGRAFREGGVH